MHPRFNFLVVILLASAVGTTGLAVGEGSEWVPDSGGNLVARISIATNQVVDTFAVGKDPEGLLNGGVLEESVAGRIAERVLEEMAGLGTRVAASCKSPIVGGSGKSKGNRRDRKSG